MQEEKGILPPDLRRYVPDLDEDGKRKKPNIPSIRSCVRAKNDDWCFVESDYQTAEIRGLAFISGDPDLIRLVTEPDPAFALVKDSVAEQTGVKVIRLHYPQDAGIAYEHQNPAFLMALVKDGKVIRKVTAADFKMTSDGAFVHPKHDLHWSLAEMVNHMPREVLNEKEHRGSGKVGNFSSAYGAMALTLERKIEADTGIKPPEGTGQKILDALARRQPVATDFLIGLEDAPTSPGYLRAASGRVRHFLSHPDNIWGISSRQKKGLLSSQGREARNFFMQESVAATAARAAAWLLFHFRENGFQARPMTVLYDSVVTHCPVEERMAVAKLHQHFMTDVNNWNYHDRWFNYPIDTDFVDAWSAKPSKERKVLLEDSSWRNDGKFINIANRLIEQSKLLAA